MRHYARFLPVLAAATLLTAVSALPAIAQLDGLTIPPSGENQYSSTTQAIGLVRVSVEYHSPQVQRPKGQDRRGKIEDLVDVRREDTLLGNQLDHIGQRLQQTMRAHARRTHAHLHVRDHLPLHPLNIGKRRQQNKRDEGKLDGRCDEKFHHGCAISPGVALRARLSITEFRVFE